MGWPAGVWNSERDNSFIFCSTSYLMATVLCTGCKMSIESRVQGESIELALSLVTYLLDYLLDYLPYLLDFYLLPLVT
jgi:hypothetical protein